MNKIFLSGRLTKDPEFQTLNNGNSVCKFTVAVSRKFKNQDGSYDSDFFNCVAWKQTADFINKYSHKGNRVSIVGSLQTRSYDSADGSKKYITEITVDEFELYETKADNEKSQSTQPQTEQQTMHKFEPIPDRNLPF